MPNILPIYHRTWETLRPWAIPWKPLPKTAFHNPPTPKLDDDNNLVSSDLPEVRPLDLLVPYHPERQLGKEVIVYTPPPPSSPPVEHPQNGNPEPRWRRHRILLLAIAIILAGGMITGGIVAGFIATRPPQQPQQQQGGTVNDNNGQYIPPGFSTLPYIVTRSIRTIETRTLTKIRTKTQTPGTRTTSSGVDGVVTTPAAVANGESAIPSQTGVM